jgi:hypothetical protein
MSDLSKPLNKVRAKMGELPVSVAVAEVYDSWEAILRNAEATTYVD